MSNVLLQMKKCHSPHSFSQSKFDLMNNGILLNIFSFVSSIVPSLFSSFVPSLYFRRYRRYFS